jgi:probable rRNA maturation factor
MARYRIAVSTFIRHSPLHEKKIIHLVRTILKEERVRAAEISIAVVGDARMAALAERYAHRRYRTDVFAFELGDSKEDLLGQVIVNAHLARDQARRLQTTPAAEMALYLAHGVLHLVGYDDHTRKDAEAMHLASAQYLRRARFREIPPLPFSFSSEVF